MDDSTENADIVIVGAGLSGLVAAATARRATGPGTRIVVFSGSQVGGRARCDDQEGFVFNRGPRALYLGGWADTTLTDLGVDVSHGGPPSTNEGVFWRAGEISPFPTNPLTLARTPLLEGRDRWRVGKFLGGLRWLKPATYRRRTVSEALSSLGFEPSARRVIESVIRVATYVNAPDQLDAEVAFTNLRMALGTGVRYLDGGWQTLVDQLVDVLTRGNVTMVDDNAMRVVPHANGSTVIGTRLRISTATTILAAGTPQACSGLLDDPPASWSDVGPAIAVGCLELGLSAPPPHRLVLGIDEPYYLSTHAPPARLAPDGGAVVHVMKYRPPGDDTPAREIRQQLDDFVRQIGIGDDTIVTSRFLPKMTSLTALPTPDRGGLAGRPDVAVDDHPGMYVAGDWVGAVGILADAAIASGAAAGRRAAAYVADPANGRVPA